MKNYKDVIKFLQDGVEAFDFSDEWDTPFCVRKLGSVFLDDRHYMLKRIMNALSRSKIKTLYLEDPLQWKEAADGRYNCVAEMIEKTKSVKFLSLAMHYTENEAKLIGEAIRKNESIESLDLYLRNSSLRPSAYLPIIGAVCENANIKILGAPTKISWGADDTREMMELMCKLFSKDAKCKLQILDLSPLHFFNDQQAKHFEILCDTFRKNESLRSIMITYTHSSSCFIILDYLNQVLFDNYSLEQICYREFSFNQEEPIPIELIKKLKRNKKFNLLKRGFPSFLLLLTITNHLQVDFFDNCTFPRELLVYIFDFLIELQFKESESTHEYFRLVQYHDHEYPFKLEDIVR